MQVSGKMTVINGFRWFGAWDICLEISGHFLGCHKKLGLGNIFWHSGGSSGRTKIRKQTQTRKDANISKIGIFGKLDPFAYFSHFGCLESSHLRI